MFDSGVGTVPEGKMMEGTGFMQNEAEYGNKELVRWSVG